MTLEVWALYGLRSNPFFQETLAGESPHFPVQLFVGRDAKCRRLLQEIFGGISTRSVIVGPPGFGKTTLAQYVKAKARDERFVASDDVVGVTSEERASGLLFRIVSYLYEAVLRRHPAAAGSDPLKAARDLLRTFRLRGFEGGVQILGSGVQGGAQPQIVRPVEAGLMAEVWRLGQEIVHEACANHGARGVILHLNNFENLVREEEVETAAQVLRDLRDFFLTPHLHTLVVGTEDVLVPALTRYPQVRSIMPFPDSLPPLSPLEVSLLLERRYEHLRIPGSPFVPPVDGGAAERVYALFRGDLRGCLRALEEASIALAGLGQEQAIEPLAFEPIARLLEPRYRDRLRQFLSDTLFERFEALASFKEGTFTAGELAKRWGVSTQRVSQLLPELERFGYVQPVGREGRTILHALSGAGRLALGIVD